MSYRIKLLLLIPHLGGGGAERVTAQLVIHLDAGRFAIHLATISEDRPGVPHLPPNVTIHRLSCERVRSAWQPILGLIHRLKPDVVFSGMAHLSFLILALRPLLPKHTRVLVRQNTTASAAATTRRSRLAYRTFYPLADSILCQSQAMADDLIQHFSISPHKLSVCPNPIDIGSIRSATRQTRRSVTQSAFPRLLCVARLSREKGIDLLLQAFASVLRVHPSAFLTVLGNGPLLADLQNLACYLNVHHAVSFPGFQSDLAHHYAQSTLFVLPSRYEGMPNALLEAAAAELPIVATPASQGLIELLHSQPGVWLTHSITSESLAETLLAAIADLQSSPGLNTPHFDHTFLAPFEVSRSIAAYAACIEQALPQA